MTKPSVSVVILPILLAASACACGGSSDPAPKGGQDAIEQEDSPPVTDSLPHGDSDATPVETFSHAIMTFTRPDGASGLSKGRFEEFSLEFGALDLEPNLDHILTFAVTPMMPPWRAMDPSSGPVIAYSDDMDVLLISPMDHFFLSLLLPEKGRIRFGLNGDVDQLPEGFSQRFLIVRGKGMAATIEHWGELLLNDRGKSRVDPLADRGLSHLGYWTDNGAYYYYKKEPAMTEEETLLAVKAEADAVGLPLGYMQLDSWWYFKAKGEGFGPGGLLTWEPLPEMFPSGLTAFQQKLGLPLILHNRWFSPESPYLEKYSPFIVDGDKAFPTDGRVFQEFAANAASWGAVTYEQDWLVLQYQGIKDIRSKVGFGEGWMNWMDSACQEKQLTMQLCMTGAAHLMASIDMQTPTSVRTSIDYAASISKESFWPQFHTVNIVAWALGIWPFKDNFHTSEKHGEAEALISILSAGMVGVGDGLGKALPEIALRTCRNDGHLLKPDRPAFPVDGMFLDHNRPLTTYTFSQTGAGRITYLAAYNIASEHPERSQADRLFAAVQYDMRDLKESMPFPNLVQDWDLDLSEVEAQGELALYNWRTCAVSLHSSSTLDLGALDHLYDFHYLVLSPIGPSGLAFIGETSKYVTAASVRFPSIQADPNGISVEISGIQGESIDVSVFHKGQNRLITKSVTMGADGKAQLRFTPDNP